MSTTAADKYPGRAWRAYGFYFKVLFIFLGSRAVILLATYFAAYFVPQAGHEVWNVSPHWYHYLLRWDSGWYFYIARDGYFYSGQELVQSPVVFFPLHPLLARFTASVLGVTAPLGVLIVSNVASLIAIPLTAKLIKAVYGAETSLVALALLSFFPASLFFSTGFSESLALLFTISFFLFLERRKFLLAALCSGLAMGTRPTSIILLLPLWWELWREQGMNWKRLVLSAPTLTALATSGLWLYMLYLWRTFGHPLAFVTGQSAWTGGSRGAGEVLLKALTLRPFGHLADFRDEGLSPATLDPWFFVLFVFVAIKWGKRLPAAWRLFLLAMLLFLYLTKAGDTVGFMSFSRYLMLAFPAFALAANSLKERAWLCLSIIGLSAAMLFMYMALYAQWYWVE